MSPSMKEDLARLTKLQDELRAVIFNSSYYEEYFLFAPDWDEEGREAIASNKKLEANLLAEMREIEDWFKVNAPEFLPGR